jgi:hypothetical protein
VANAESEETTPEAVLEDPVYGPFVLDLLQSVLETLIANGEVTVGHKSTTELMREAADYILDRPEFFDEWTATVSYETSLLTEARRYVVEARPELALMMFATWIEHRLNWLLMDAARRRGLTLRQASQVVRDANMPQKTGTTWLLLFGRPLDSEIEKDIGKVATSRNNFVHYKWPEGHVNDGVPKRDDLAAAISAAERAVRGLDDMLTAHVYAWDDKLQATDRQGGPDEGAPQARS